MIRSVFEQRPLDAAIADAGSATFEETGLRPRLLERPAAAAVRSFGPGLPTTLSLSYAAIGDPEQPLIAEDGQPAAWMRLDQGWDSCFPDDVLRVRQYVKLLRSGSSAW